MSTISATFTSRKEHDELFTNWPFWGLVKPHAYPYGAFINECEITHVECALKLLDEGKIDKVEMFSFDNPMESGETCGVCYDYIVEPWCGECGTEGGDDNPVLIGYTGEEAMCRDCFNEKLEAGEVEAGEFR